MSAELERFVDAQMDVYPGVLAELRCGHKTGHWIWFIFPQVAGLGTKRDLPGVRHPLTGGSARLRRSPDPRRAPAPVRLGRGRARRTDTEEIFGPLDAMKVRSSMTLFLRAAPDEAVFVLVLDGSPGDPGPGDRRAAGMTRLPDHPVGWAALVALSPDRAKAGEPFPSLASASRRSTSEPRAEALEDLTPFGDGARTAGSSTPINAAMSRIVRATSNRQPASR